MKSKFILSALFLALLTAGINASSYETDAAEDSLPQRGESIKVTTLNTELKTHNQVHVKGKTKDLERVNKNTMKFIKKIAKSAHDSANEHDLYASVTIAQAILESASGTSGLSRAPYNNLFGVKGSYNGKSVNLPTKEDDGNGNLYSINSYFAVYPDWEASIKAHDHLLKYGLPNIYSGAWKSKTENYKQAAQHLQGRYATDTSYASKLISIIKTYNLTRFDEPLSERDLAWLRSDSLDPWELPIVPPKITKERTWASAYDKMPDKYKKITKDITYIELEEITEPFYADVYYVERVIGSTIDFMNRELITPRKGKPKEGDILVYKVLNAEKEYIERYAVVEAIDDETILISEGVRDEKGIHSIYRTIDIKELDKYEYIKGEDVK